MEPSSAANVLPHFSGFPKIHTPSYPSILIVRLRPITEPEIRWPSTGLGKNSISASGFTNTACRRRRHVSPGRRPTNPSYRATAGDPSSGGRCSSRNERGGARRHLERPGASQKTSRDFMGNLSNSASNIYTRPLLQCGWVLFPRMDPMPTYEPHWCKAQWIHENNRRVCFQSET